MTKISKMGLMEIARQRLKSAKMSAMYTACPTCEGYGLIKNLEAAAIAAVRKLQTRSARGDAGKICLRLPQDVATWMLNNKRDEVVQIERRQRVSIDIVPDSGMLRHETEMEVLPREENAAPAAVTTDGRTVALPPEAEPVAAEERSTSRGTGRAREGEEESTTAPRRRRRRRRKPAAAEAEPDRGTEESLGGSKIVPFARTTPEQAEPPTTEAADSDPETTESEGASPPRRKRRRRRRSRSAGSGGAETEGVSEVRAPVIESAVPQNVQSNELMPAAAGEARRSGRGSRGGSGRRRGRGPKGSAGE